MLSPRSAPPRYYPPLPEKMPVTLLFRGEIVEGNSEYVRHAHPWSQIICVKSGVLAMLVAGQRYLAPREFAIWVPAGVEHSSYNRKTTRFCAIDIAPVPRGRNFGGLQVHYFDLFGVQPPMLQRAEQAVMRG